MFEGFTENLPVVDSMPEGFLLWLYRRAGLPERYRCVNDMPAETGLLFEHLCRWELNKIAIENSPAKLNAKRMAMEARLEVQGNLEQRY